MDSLVNENSLGQKLKVIFALAIPAVVENFFQTIIGFVDILFISKLGLIEVTAVGITNAVLQVYFAIFMSLGVAANIYIARYIGAEDSENTRKIAQQSIILAVISGLILGLITLFFARDLLMLLGAEPEVLDAGEIYFKIVAIPSIVISLMFVLSSILRGTGDTKTPMKVSIWINLLNIVLDYVFIFGFYFIPALGLVGAGMATVIARLIGSLLLFYYLSKTKSIHSFRFIDWMPKLDIQKRLLIVGSPAAGERLVMRIGQVLYFGFVIQMGTNTFAAHTIAGNIEVFSYMIGYGLATAATTLVGQLLGAGQTDTAKDYAFLLTILSIGVMSLVGVILYFSGGWIGTFFTKDVEVLRQISIALKIDAFIQPILGAVIVLTGVFQGGGNTKIPMYITAIGIWVIRTGGVYLLGISLNLGIAGIWVAIGLDNLFRAVSLWYKYRRHQWIRKDLFNDKETRAN
ncbi:MATE family efflux transporter [Alkalihalobacillus sp. AL-G]|uniref:MATE family efflux transporter n=1 Tax=Alkalihalobacillus sp. AL-G TaxID=2926399 RepID=UPI00272D170C|nr:MATE family efflux transporter [Alkalihalobacillus sp. AL-G]WLD92017.1 MATE family efflux transporter [Alkalihalobacillus sp. AL-G]